MVNPNNFFDLWDLLANELFGGTFIFFAVGAIVVLIITMRTRMNFQQSFMLLLLWGLIFVGMSGNLAIWTGIGLGVAVFFSIMVSRIFRRG